MREPLGQLVPRAARVAALEVQQAGGDHDQPLVEVAVLFIGRAPQRLPGLVRMPVAEPVEEGHAPMQEVVRFLRVERWGPSASAAAVRAVRRGGVAAAALRGRLARAGAGFVFGSAIEPMIAVERPRLPPGFHAILRRPFLGEELVDLVPVSDSSTSGGSSTVAGSTRS